jgi:outer membrane protein assembly factor BamD
VKWLATAGAAGMLFLCASPSNSQLLHRKKPVNKSTSADNTAAPDQVLYARALDDIKHGRHEVGRLGMQTLINTYPDSEYLAKAKLAIADSYYHEGGTANMVQAIQGYKDFGVFFPFLPEAAYAQLQVANAHYQQMAKPDRDRTEAKAAEDELQVFLQKYPKDPLAPKAEQRLRDVQEVIAEGDYRIGAYYYVKGDRRAAAARLIGVTRRYPLYSKSDKALWMLGDIFEKSEHKEIASLYFAQIVRNYPLSAEAGDAKNKLIAYKFPVPQPDPKAVAWMRTEQNTPRPKVPVYKKPLSLIKGGPEAELQASAKNGVPTMQPESDNTSATDVLTGGNRSQIGGGPGSAGSSAVVETVTPGTGGARENGGAATGTEGATQPPPAEGAAPPPPAAGESRSAAPPAATTENGTAAPADAPKDPAKGDAPATTDATQSTDGTKTDTAAAKTDDAKKESTSKKKKGLRKIVPW